MLVKLCCSEHGLSEWCLLEFQGEIVGDVVGQQLGFIEIKKVPVCINGNYSSVY